MNSNHIKGKRVLLAGGSGFVGSHLVKHFQEAGAEIFILDPETPRMARIFNGFIPRFTYYRSDLLNQYELHEIIAKVWPEVVIHLGASLNRERNYPNIYKGIYSDIQGTVNLMESISGTDYEHFLYFSSAEVYGNTHVPPFEESMHSKPVSPYSATKIATEQFVITCSAINKRPYTILRPFQLYGEGQSMNMFIPEFINTALKGIPFRMTYGKQTRDLVYIDDLCSAVLSVCLTKTTFNEVLNICSGVEVSMIEMAELMSELMGGVELLPGSYEYKGDEIWNLFGSAVKMKKMTGWQAQTPMLEGLTRTINWFRQNETENREHHES